MNYFSSVYFNGNSCEGRAFSVSVVNELMEHHYVEKLIVTQTLKTFLAVYRSRGIIPESNESSPHTPKNPSVSETLWHFMIYSILFKSAVISPRLTPKLESPSFLARLQRLFSHICNYAACLETFFSTCNIDDTSRRAMATRDSPNTGGYIMKLTFLKN